MKLIKQSIVLLVILITVQSQAQLDIDSYDEEGRTSLINAVSSKDHNKVRSLLSKGANVNFPEQKGLEGTPLMYATSTGDLKLCELLIEKGADVNQLAIFLIL